MLSYSHRTIRIRIYLFNFYRSFVTFSVQKIQDAAAVRGRECEKSEKFCWRSGRTWAWVQLASFHHPPYHSNTGLAIPPRLFPFVHLPFSHFSLRFHAKPIPQVVTLRLLLLRPFIPLPVLFGRNIPSHFQWSGNGNISKSLYFLMSSGFLGKHWDLGWKTHIFPWARRSRNAWFSQPVPFSPPEAWSCSWIRWR